MSTEKFKNVTSCFVINLLNNKTIILPNLAEYRLILADSAYLSIRRYSARFRRIIVKCRTELRGNGTLKYGDVHEKSNFSECKN